MTMTTHGSTAYAIAGIATVLGVASLSLFGVFLWTGSFDLVEMRMQERTALSWDAGLCLLFFLQHSVMVRKSFRARLHKVLPEHCHGIVYTIASAVALLLLAGAWQRSTIDIYALAGVPRWLLRAVLLLAFAGFAWGIKSLGEFDAFGVEAFLSHRRGQERGPARLTIEGPYRFVRHPFYFCAIVALWATPALSLDRLLLNVLFTAWIVLGATLEERDLLAEFGEQYRLYQRAVPMLVPRKAGWRKPVAKRAAAGGQSG